MIIDPDGEYLAAVTTAKIGDYIPGRSRLQDPNPHVPGLGGSDEGLFIGRKSTVLISPLCSR